MILMLTPRQEQIVNILEECPYTFSRQLQAELNVSRARLSQLIVPLINEGVVLRLGKARNTRYRLAQSKVMKVEFLEKENAKLKRQVKALTQQLEDGKLIERAKEIIMAQFNVRPTEAYRRLQEESMKSGKLMREVAEAILMPYEGA
jgi:hypothetical protein